MTHRHATRHIVGCALLFTASCARVSTSPAPRSPRPMATDVGSNTASPRGQTADAEPVPSPPAPPQQQPAPLPPASEPASSLRETFPGLRIDTARRIIELDATVPINAQAERVYLEVLACTPNSREHETLVVTDVKPSHVHAMLLLLGLQPGTAPRWDFDGTNLTPVPPTGPRLAVFLRRKGEQADRNVPLQDLVTSVRQAESLARYVRPDQQSPDHLVFAGSRVVEGIYAADMSGTLIGLTAFGDETIAWSGMYHPDSDRMTPEWIADGTRLPPAGTAVVVTIQVP